MTSHRTQWLRPKKVLVGFGHVGWASLLDTVQSSMTGLGLYDTYNR